MCQIQCYPKLSFFLLLRNQQGQRSQLLHYEGHPLHCLFVLYGGIQLIFLEEILIAHLTHRSYNHNPGYPFPLSTVDNSRFQYPPIL